MTQLLEWIRYMLTYLPIETISSIVAAVATPTVVICLIGVLFRSKKARVKEMALATQDKAMVVKCATLEALVVGKEALIEELRSEVARVRNDISDNEAIQQLQAFIATQLEYGKQDWRNLFSEKLLIVKSDALQARKAKIEPVKQSITTGVANIIGNTVAEIKQDITEQVKQTKKRLKPKR